MFRFAIMSALASGIVAVPARAADLPVHHRHSRLGAIFAEPAPVARGDAARVTGHETVYAPLVDIPQFVNGYYGKPKSYAYRSYYGTSPELIFDRLPYACGRYGYC